MKIKKSDFETKRKLDIEMRDKIQNSIIGVKELGWPAHEWLENIIEDYRFMEKERYEKEGVFDNFYDEFDWKD